MSARELLHDDAPEVIVRVMITFDRAVDLFVGDLARRGYSERTRATYSRILDKFGDRLPTDSDVSRVTSDDCRRFLDLYNRNAPGTRAHIYAVLSSFFTWLIVTEKTKRNPLVTVPRPRRQRPDDLDVVSLSTEDVRKLLAAGQTWTERLAIAIPAYIGPRRRAVAQLRLRDYDRDRGRMRFQEKGGKTIWKPVPDELGHLLAAAIADGAIREPDDYLVPPEGYLSKSGTRDDRVIWRVVRRVAARAGVDAHVHALRAAFAVFYLEQHPGDTHGLKELLGHRSYDTTQVYLRKLDKTTAMERVRDLSWNIAVRTGERVDTQVYFISAGDVMNDGTPVKIGWAADPRARLDQLQTGHHEQLELVAVVPGGEALEQQLHRDLSGDHIRGEWFRSSSALRGMVASLEGRMVAGAAANSAAESSLEVGAGGFEPPSSVSSQPEQASTQHLADTLLGAAQAAADPNRAERPEAVQTTEGIEA